MKKSIDIKLFKQFLEEYLPSQDEKIPTTINQGGCGFFACALSKVLSGMGIDNKILALFIEGDDSYPYFSEFMKSGAIVPNCTMSHCVVEIDGEQFDPMGKFDGKLFDCRISKTSTIDCDKISTLVKHKNLWNDNFDRRQDAAIEKYLKAIPTQFSRWHKGKFTHTIKEEDKKPLNKYTKLHMSHPFSM